MLALLFCLGVRRTEGGRGREDWTIDEALHSFIERPTKLLVTLCVIGILLELLEDG